MGRVASRFQRRLSHDERAAWEAGIYEIYREMRESNSDEVKYFDSLRIRVLPTVYSPFLFTDSRWFSAVLAECVGEGSLLEVGCGSGVISLCCARQGATVCAVDVNAAAVQNTRLNAELNGLGIEVYESDIYAGLPNECSFDFVFWAHPFNNAQQPHEDPLLCTGFDFEYCALRRYVCGARKYLQRGGSLLLGSGDTADLALIETIAEENGYGLRVLRHEQRPLTYAVDQEMTLLLLEFVRE